MSSMTVERIAKVFNGIHTITHKKTGEYFTFSIRTQPEDHRFKPGERIISILHGPDNVHNYRAFGTLTDEGIQVWSRFKGTVTEQKGNLFWLVVTTNPDDWDHLLAGRCIRCNRLLTTPSSIYSGIGPICESREIVHPNPQIEELLRTRAKLRRMELDGGGHGNDR